MYQESGAGVIVLSADGAMLTSSLTNKVGIINLDELELLDHGGTYGYL